MIRGCFMKHENLKKNFSRSPAASAPHDLQVKRRDFVSSQKISSGNIP
jgi:hypothetical protein